MIINITDGSFKTEVLDSVLPVLVEFWADWCGPCKTFAPILESLAQDYANRLKFVKISIENNQKIPNEYNIRSIPTIIIFKKVPIDTRSGLMSKDALRKWLDSLNLS